MTTTQPTTGPSILTPADPGYDDARRAWNLAVDLRPAGVAIARSTDDVVALVRRAREDGLRVAVQGTGHLAASLPDLADALLVKTAIEPKVVVDAERRTVRVGAGALWGEVIEALRPHGLAALSGSSHDVGVIGYLLGGGLSWLGRAYGLAVNHVRTAEAVLPDGRVVTASPDSEPDLFWALRGGGGNFAVVTSVELDVLAISEVFAGIAIWDGEHAGEILRRWNRWTRDAPETMTTSARILQLPPLPTIPEPLQARPLVAIDGAALGGSAEALGLLEQLRAVAEPVMDTWAPIAPADLLHVHMDPPEPVPGIGHHAMLGELDDAGIDAFVAAAGPGSGSPLLLAELRQLGGALSRPGEGCARLDGAFALLGVGLPMDPQLAAAITAHLDRLVAALAPWATGGMFLSFAERGGDLRTAFDEESYGRLQAIRSACDPQETLVAGHRVAVPA